MDDNTETVEAQPLPILKPFQDIPYKELRLKLDELPLDGELEGPMPSKGFIADIKLRDVINPITVVVNPKGGYRVIMGRRRIKAARAAGLKRIRARVYQEDCTELQLAVAAENNQRTSNDMSDLLVVSQLRQQGHDDKAIAKLTGIPPGRVKKISKLTQLEDPLWNAVVDGKMTMQAARLATKLSAKAQVDLATEKLGAGERITVDDVAATRTTARREQQRAVVTLPDMSVPTTPKQSERPYVVFGYGHAMKQFDDIDEAREFARKYDTRVFRLVPET